MQLLFGQPSICLPLLLKWLFVIVRTGDARARARRTYGDRSYSRGAADSTTNIVAGVAETRYERRAVRPCANKPYCSSYLANRAISLSNPNADPDYYDLPSDRFPTTASRELRFFRISQFFLSLVYFAWTIPLASTGLWYGVHFDFWTL